MIEANDCLRCGEEEMSKELGDLCDGCWEKEYESK